MNKTNIVLKDAKSRKIANLSELVGLEDFTKALNKKPDVTKTNKYANNTQYVPISHIQTLLDTLFFGLWETKNFKYTVIGNEIAASVELWVFHPVIKQWIVRQGAAATQIRMNKGASVMDISQKIKNSIEMDLPHALSDCVKSAAKTLGPAFGRDLNRDFVDNYKAMVSGYVEKNTYSVEDVAEKLQTMKNEKQIVDYWETNQLWQNDPNIITLFEERKRDVRDESF